MIIKRYIFIARRAENKMATLLLFWLVYISSFRQHRAVVMATAQLQPNVSKDDILVVNIVKQLCTSVTGLSNGRCQWQSVGNRSFTPSRDNRFVRGGSVRGRMGTIVDGGIYSKAWSCINKPYSVRLGWDCKNWLLCICDICMHCFNSVEEIVILIISSKQMLSYICTH